MSGFRAIHIDHVELFVPDRHEAAAWYERVLGLTVLAEYQGWALDSRGPLMISGDGGSSKLALFEGARAPGPGGGFHRVAFRLDAQTFMECLRRLGELRVRTRAAGASRGTPWSTMRRRTPSTSRIRTVIPWKSRRTTTKPSA